MEDGSAEVEWGPRVSKQRIRRLYESFVSGLLDEALLEDVGISLYLRCQAIFDVDAAKRGRVRCPRCKRQGRESIVPRQYARDRVTEAIACACCGWRTTWGAYAKTFQRKQLNLGGARPAFEHFVAHYPLASGAHAKMLLVDRLIHEFHYSLRERPDVPTRAVAVNLIEGKLTDVVAFLDRLTYGDRVPESKRTQDTWRRELARLPWGHDAGA